MITAGSSLPDGVALHPLATHRDERGAFTELFRREWATGVDPVQWNAVASATGVLRGVHVHVRHADYLTMVRGRAAVGLRDLRRGSATDRRTAIVELSADTMAAIVIPPGVAHGFLFLEPSTHVYAVTHYWDLEDELGCHWADPALELDWPRAPAMLSPRDADAGPLDELLERLAPHQDRLASLT